MIRGDLGYLILTRSGPDSVLAILATKSAKLGLIFLDAARTAKEIARTLA
jgi:predicted regulator of Ras-like GTPase activity (Roadblock/LC7/MglB family)